MFDAVLVPIITGLCIFALGMGTALWIKSRPVTTKAEAMRLLTAELKLVQKLPGAAEQHELVDAQLKDEIAAAADLAKASGVQP